MKETKFSRKLRDLGYVDYDDYLASEHWKNKKEEYAESNRPRYCLVCGSLKYILHHLTYENLGAESLDDFMPLCMGCHHKLHLLMKTKGWAHSKEDVISLLIKKETIVKVLGKPKSKKHKRPKLKEKRERVESRSVQVIIEEMKTMTLEEVKLIAGASSQIIHRLKMMKRKQ